MLFVKIENDIPTEYPLTFFDLEKILSRSVTVDDISYLETLGYYPVTTRDFPNISHTQNVRMAMPEFIDGVWFEKYEVYDKTSEQIEIDTENAKITARNNRNYLLQVCDWTQLLDANLSDDKKNEWKIYRQALRDVTEQTGFPWNIIWPEQPV
jgi:hypothetical protein